MATINPYLNFNGTTEEAFLFYKSVFGGEFTMIQRFKDIPDGDKMPPEVQNKIMYIGLPIGHKTTLMATDALESLGQKIVAGNNHYISIQAESKEEADRLYQSLSAGGTIEQPIGDQFWGAYFGIFMDKYGIQWMVNYDYPFTIERTFNAPSDLVWKAITNRDDMKQWYFDIKEFKAEPGFEFQFYGGQEGGIQYLHLCRVTEVVPGKKLTYSWKYDQYDGISYVTFELFPEGNKTRLKLTHAGIESFPANNPDLVRRNFEAGWTGIFDTSLKPFLEK
jgi:PhnB protein